MHFLNLINQLSLFSLDLNTDTKTKTKRDLEALDKADNIELQFYKDEVKKLKKQEINLKAQIEKMNELNGKLKSDYDDAFNRLQNVENENKKIVRTTQLEFRIFDRLIYLFKFNFYLNFNNRKINFNSAKRNQKMTKLYFKN